jgi:hypothetical protein
MYQLPFVKTINNIAKLDTDLKTLEPKYVNCTIRGDNLTVNFESILVQGEIDAVSNLINTFVETSLHDQVVDALKNPYTRFVDQLMFDIAAENMLMGITQLGKTADFVGLLENPVTLPGKPYPTSLYTALRINALTVAMDILDYYMADMATYEIAPFVTTERFTAIKATISNFEGAS